MGSFSEREIHKNRLFHFFIAYMEDKGYCIDRSFFDYNAYDVLAFVVAMKYGLSLFQDAKKNIIKLIKRVTFYNYLYYLK